MNSMQTTHSVLKCAVTSCVGVPAGALGTALTSSVGVVTSAEAGAPAGAGGRGHTSGSGGRTSHWSWNRENKSREIKMQE